MKRSQPCGTFVACHDLMPALLSCTHFLNRNNDSQYDDQAIEFMPQLDGQYNCACSEIPSVSAVGYGKPAAEKRVLREE